MGKLKVIDFEEESIEIKDKVKDYWTDRADSFYDQRVHEIESYRSALWTDEILRMIEKKGQLNILDIGCGAGFFEVILGKKGHRVTGIDLTDEMVEKANAMIKLYQLPSDQVKAYVMDAESLDFPENSFDLIVTRNLTWTLPHPVKAYSEWYRVLKEGGMLLNFDAEYAKNAHIYNDEDNLAHKVISKDMKDACHEIYHMLTISTLSRPEWDKQILMNIGFAEVDYDLDFYKRIFAVKDEFYIPDHMFMICAKKGY